MHIQNHSTNGKVDAAVVAFELGVSVKTARRWFKDGRFPGYKMGRRCVRFDLDEVRAAVLTPSRINAA